MKKSIPSRYCRWYAMRLYGYSYAEIEEKAGIAHSTVSNAISTVIKAIHGEIDGVSRYTIRDAVYREWLSIFMDDVQEYKPVGKSIGSGE